jgi:hypothetical protein
MAIQKASLSSVEHDWFATRSGVSNIAPLNDHKAAYFVSKGFGSNASIQKSVSQMEQEWLISVGGTTKWADALMAQGETPTVSENENKTKFFCNVTGTP